ncbi:hypothetical protein [Fusibacter bizertensis]
MSLDTFTAKYRQFLSEESSSLLSISTILKNEHREDEYKFNRIESNIVDIFGQMFNISLTKVNTTSNWKKELEAAYLSFFTKIPASWHQNLKECKAHGLDEEIYIENLKIDRAEAIKHKFIALLEEENG